MYRALFLQIVFLSLVLSSHPALGAALDPADDAALVALYNATSGGSWTNNSGWSGTTGIMDTVNNPPYGVMFDGTGRVLRINLSSNSLTGDISALDLSGLTNLTNSLNLSGNTLSGGMPDAIHLPPSLQFLNLSTNPLTGSFADYSAMTSLIMLTLEDCQLSGSLPTAAQLPPNIEDISLRTNQFSGAFPDYSTLLALSKITFSANPLGSSLPSAAQLPPHLAQLWIKSAQLTGTIPDYSSLSSLIALGLDINMLEGSLPTATQLPATFQALYIQQNQLTGTIPDYSSLINLRQLQLQYNRLSGELPALVELPAGMDELIVNDNLLTGTIPDYSTLALFSTFYPYNQNIQGPTPAGLLAWSGSAIFTTTPVIDPALDGSGQPAGTVTVTGSGGEIGGTVNLLLDGVSVTTGLAVGGVGEWSGTIDMTGKVEGAYVLTATSTFDGWPGYGAGQTSAVNSTPVTINVDLTAPVITLNGSAQQSVEQGSTYTDPGVTITDNVDTELTAIVTGSVDTSIVGTYTLTYNVTDNAGNAATPVERTVTVTAAPNNSGGGGGGAPGLPLLAVLAALLPWRKWCSAVLSTQFPGAGIARRFRLSFFLIGVLALTACGSGGGGSTATTTTHTISGTVSGLSGSGLVLQNNGGDDLNISADSGFSFSTQIADGSSYAVSVLTQPSTPPQVCTVSNGTGTVAGADVTNVSVTCVTTYTINVSVSGLKGTGLVLQNNGGDDLSIATDGSSSFTTQIASGATYAVSILTQPTTPTQNCVVSYGSGTVSGSDVSDIEVLCSNYWTWMSGSDVVDQTGVYGVKGVADAANVPGARKDAVPWRDSTGTLWLFGGEGIGGGYHNDLWKFDGTNWTWVSGSNVVNQFGVYGTKGLAAATNVPGARAGATTWVDSGGVLWLFGGYGRGKTTIGIVNGRLNDLWKFDGTNWIWVSGSDAIDPSAVYGTKGVANASNVPGGRAFPYSWIDSSNTLWLFGGYGHDSTGVQGRLNDLWKFDGTNWTWISGSNTGNQIGVYGTQGIANVTNIPGGRNSGSSWIDSSNTLWLFGGYGYDSTGAQNQLNDLWKFDGSDWIWVSGSDLIGQLGAYGTKGVAASSNVPGARFGSTSWVDSSDTLWLFGGSYYFNDLWKFDGVDWTWVSGSNLTNQAGIYGTQATPSAANIPGARHYSTSWIDSNNNLWLFGGYGFDSTGTNNNLNDLWRYTP